ncbi:hypothetical protein ACEQ8H_001418 [Pleosporales sp. CAS-2024a]
MSKQTNIIDDPDIVTLAMQGRQRRGPAKKTQVKSRGPDPSGLDPTESFPTAKHMKSKAASEVTGRKFYDKNGIRIPLYEQGGKKRAHARLARSLRNKTANYLLAIVEQYAGTEKMKEFKKADMTKAEMADWIEGHETYALGPNPRSQHLGAKGKSKYQDTVQSPVQQDVKKSAKTWDQPPEPDQGTKRKLDQVSDPVRGAEQTAKKMRTRNMIEQLAEQMPVGHKAKDERCKSRNEEHALKISKTTKLAKITDTCLAPTDEEVTKAKSKDMKLHNERLTHAMGLLEIDSKNPDASSKIVRLPEQGGVRVLTAVTDPRTGKHRLHETTIPYGYNPAESSRRLLGEPPFLKDGIHGKGGHFDGDPDRRTGRGHEVTPEDEAGAEAYMRFQNFVYTRYPYWPSVGEGEEVPHAFLGAWAENEGRRIAFRNKYPGRAVNHLWDCGCEKLRGESEDEDSEED